MNILSFNMRPHEGRLFYTLVDNNTDRVVKFGYLIRLYDHERFLSEGRFFNFNSNEKRNPIVVGEARTFDSTQIKIIFGRCLEWLAEEVTGKWGFEVHGSNDTVGRPIFYFSSEEDSIMFKLSLQYA